MREVTRLHDRRGSARLIASLFYTYVIWVSLSCLICPISPMTLGYAQESPDVAPRSESEDQMEDKTSTHTTNQAQAKIQTDHDVQTQTEFQTKASMQTKIEKPSTVRRQTLRKKSTKGSPKRITQAQIDDQIDVQINAQTDTSTDTPTEAQKVVTTDSPINTQTETENHDERPAVPSDTCPITQAPELQSHLRIVKLVGIECKFCVKGIKDRLQRIAGVQSVEVNLKSGEVTVKVYTQKPPAAEELCGALKAAGYQVRAITQPRSERLMEEDKKQKSSSKTTTETEQKGAVTNQISRRSILRDSEQRAQKAVLDEIHEKTTEEIRDQIQEPAVEEPQDQTQEKVQEPAIEETRKPEIKEDQKLTNKEDQEPAIDEDQEPAAKSDQETAVEEPQDQKQETQRADQ